MTRVGIVVALAQELKTLTAAPAQLGTVIPLSDNVLVTLSGMGGNNAGAAAQHLLDCGADALLSWGSAAALSDVLRPGELVLPRAIIDHEGRALTVRADWHERVSRQLIPRFPVTGGSLTQSPSVLTTASEKHSLHRRTDALAADMETPALAEAAHQARVPFLAIRAISDAAAMRIPNYLLEATDAVGRTTVSAVAAIVSHPGDWPAVARLAWGFNKALSTLKRAFMHLGTDGLLPPPSPIHD